MLYKKLDVPEIEVIINEILQLVSPQISQNLRYWDLPVLDFYSSTPNFFKFITGKIFRNTPKQFRFYNTPPYTNLGPHIDNVPTAKIGLNIPLLNTKNTAMNYYDTPEDNLELQSEGGFGGLPAQVIKDKRRLVLVDSIELDKPTLLRTDRIHEVINQNNSYRLILGMKYIGNSFEDVYKGTN